MRKSFRIALRTLGTLVAIFLFLAMIRGVVDIVAQTKVDGGQQIKNLIVSPIVSVQRSTCMGTGTNTVTNPDNTTTTMTWDCAGIQLFKMTLADGTIVGPYIAVQATTQQAAAATWQSIPLNSPNAAQGQ